MTYARRWCVRRADDRIHAEPVVGERRDEPIQQLAGHERREPLVGCGDGRGERQQDVVGEPLRVRSAGVPVRVAPGEVDRQRRAMIDQPRPAAPGEEVRVPRRAVRVRQEPVEPDDAGRPVRVRDASTAGLKVRAPGRKSSPMFRPTLATSRSWISWCGSLSAIALTRSTATRSGTRGRARGRSRRRSTPRRGRAAPGRRRGTSRRTSRRRPPRRGPAASRPRGRPSRSGWPEPPAS